MEASPINSLLFSYAIYAFKMLDGGGFQPFLSTGMVLAADEVEASRLVSEIMFQSFPPEKMYLNRKLVITQATPEFMRSIYARVPVYATGHKSVS